MFGVPRGARWNDAGVNAAVIHARAPGEAGHLAGRLRARLDCREVLVGDLAASLAVHGDRGVIGLFACPA